MIINVGINEDMSKVTITSFTSTKTIIGWLKINMTSSKNPKGNGGLEVEKYIKVQK
jgi:hypothetical protein